MGARSGIETIVAILGAFLHENRTWSQSDLARKLGLTVPGLKQPLEKMLVAGFPFEREREGGQVYWSLPKSWMPGAVLVDGDDLPDLLWAVARGPRSELQQRVLKRLARGAPSVATGARTVDAIDAPRAGSDESFLRRIEDAITKQSPVRVRYQRAKDPVAFWREFSPQGISYGSKGARFAAVCHESQALRWLRVDGIQAFDSNWTGQWHEVTRDELERFRHESLDGYRSGSTSVESFVVSAADMVWVLRNLPGEWKTERCDDGLRVIFETSGLLPLARYVAGLGAAVQRIETAGLATMVREIAQTSLRLAEVTLAVPSQDREASG